MSVIIDRRKTTKGKSTVNRDRFIRRYKGLIKEQVDKTVAGRSMKDMDKSGEDIVIRKNDVSEPFFHHRQGSGSSERVLPGNDRFIEGDRIPKNPGGSSGGGDGDGEDSFTFALSREEFMNLFFDELELPHLIRTQMASMVEHRPRRAGFVRFGTPGNLSVTRTMKTALARRIALEGSVLRRIEEGEERLHAARVTGDTTATYELEEELLQLRQSQGVIPFIDDVDLRYRGTVMKEEPKTAAVMFCLMDVSGSMDELRKDLAKRFFTLLYLFLSRKYEKVELVFIRHTHHAEECDEDTFFHDTASGGTLVVSALEEMKRIVNERYPASQWNIYAAQASDGDAFDDDGDVSAQYLLKELLPLTRYYVYVETNETDHNAVSPLWQAYSRVRADNFNMARVHGRNEIYPALADLFSRDSKEKA